MHGFISYCHDDFECCEAFQIHLKAVERAYSASFWVDKRIHAGSYWDGSIQDAIERSDIFILLISPGFIASDYIYNQEIPAIRARQQKAGGLVLPVVLKRCMWQMIANVLQAIPSQAGRVKPIIEWRPQENGYDSARDEIGKAINRHFGISVAPIDWSKP